MKTPQIGLIVEREIDGVFVEDWCCQVLLVIGKDKDGKDITESGVIVWGSTGERHQPGKDSWRYCVRQSSLL